MYQAMKNNPAVAAATFGCKVNQYETACILDAFVSAGYRVVPFDSPADVYIINSCTVTNRTDYKSRNALRKALKHKQQHPGTQVVITGCYVQRNYEEVQALGPIDHIIDNNKKDQIVAAVQGARVPFEDINHQTSFAELFTTSMQDRTRAFIKVQDGCDYYCAYCAVAHARGPSRSRDADKVLQQIAALAQHGYKEFVLGGINLGLFGREKQDGYHLSHLIADIASISGVELIRLSSVEPQLIDDPLLDAIASTPQMCPHFHVPLQSGSDTLLSSMGRHYTTARFAEIIGSLQAIDPMAAIGLDVITGLPGETDELARQTYDFLTNLDFSYLHVFSYSSRPGTRAEKMPGHVNGTVIHTRTQQLTALSEARKQTYRDRLIAHNTPLRGVIEQQIDGLWTALSDHYLRLYVAADSLREGAVVHCTSAAPHSDGLKAEVQ
jgi:threonylcarbamoyladenosine tRNA methylthiotransferase MtaB